MRRKINGAMVFGMVLVSDLMRWFFTWCLGLLLAVLLACTSVSIRYCSWPDVAARQCSKPMGMASYLQKNVTSTGVKMGINMKRASVAPGRLGGVGNEAVYKSPRAPPGAVRKSLDPPDIGLAWVRDGVKKLCGVEQSSPGH